MVWSLIEGGTQVHLREMRHPVSIEVVVIHVVVRVEHAFGKIEVASVVFGGDAVHGCNEVVHTRPNTQQRGRRDDHNTRVVGARLIEDPVQFVYISVKQSFRRWPIEQVVVPLFDGFRVNPCEVGGAIVAFHEVLFKGSRTKRHTNVLKELSFAFVRDDAAREEAGFKRFVH